MYLLKNNLKKILLGLKLKFQSNRMLCKIFHNQNRLINYLMKYRRKKEVYLGFNLKYQSCNYKFKINNNQLQFRFKKNRLKKGHLG